jgi:hypothetical protein
MGRITGGRSARILLSTTTLAVFGLLFGVFGLEAAAAPRSHGSSQQGNALSIDVLSNRADLISGGDALVEVHLPRGVSPSSVRVDVDGRDVTSSFAVRPDGRFLGVVTGLTVGENILRARVPHHGARITITNHPVGGPIFSGPQLMPYFCRTENFGLGPAQDAQCNAPTLVSWRYKSATSGALLTYNPASPPPAAEIATTTTDQGVTAPYIVRIERGTTNRGIHDIAVLADPNGSWAPWALQPTWNHKVLWQFGGGTAPWRTQAGPQLALTDFALGRGFMLANSSLNVRGQNANDWISAETVMMLQEHIRETFGAIRYTIGSGCSGGSIQQHLIAANYPGLLDGIMPNCSYEDSWTTAMEVTDCALLIQYFTLNPAGWTPAQRAAVDGHKDTSACGFWQATFVPVGNPSLPQNCNLHTSPALAALVYNPLTNPTGIRCTVQDHQVAIWGKRPDGFAKRPVDNIGLQYGLNALEAGRITPEQFVDLNEKVGGTDIDSNSQAQRMAADPGSMRTAYWAGQVTNARRLAEIPIIDLRGSANVNDIHTDFHTYSLRARLDAANGGHENQIVWTWPSLGAFVGIGTPAPVALSSFLLMDRWLSAIEADHSNRPLRVKVLNAKPADAVDQCYATPAGNTPPITDAATCAAMFPWYGDSRLAAGMPLSHDILKCRLKPLDRNDYGGAVFTDAQWTRLEVTFPTGVCDWTRKGVGQFIQSFAHPWLTFEDGPGGRPLGRDPKSHPTH